MQKKQTGHLRKNLIVFKKSSHKGTGFTKATEKTFFFLLVLTFVPSVFLCAFVRKMGDKF